MTSLQVSLAALASVLFIVLVGCMSKGDDPLVAESGNPMGGRNVAHKVRLIQSNDCPDYRSRWAVVIGINKYKHWPDGDLTYAVADATAIRDILAEEFGYSPTPNDDDPQTRIRFLIDGQATKEAIEKTFTEWLPTRVQEDDAVLIYFSGHGTEDGYLAAHNTRKEALATTGVSIKEITEHFENGPLRHCAHKAVILDSCFSGVLFDDRPRRQRTTPGIKNNLIGQENNSVDQGGNSIGRSTRGGNSSSGGGTAAEARVGDINLLRDLEHPTFMGMSAAQSWQKAADGGGAGKHSLFTWSLLQELTDRANTLRTDDHIFRFSELAARVKVRVTNQEGSTQKPQWGWVGDGEGDFVFRPTLRRRTPRERSKWNAELNHRGKYALNLSRVRRLLDIDPAFASDILDDDTLCEPRLREFSWGIMRQRCALQVHALGSHTGPLQLLGFAFDDTHIVSCDMTGVVALWSVSNGMRVATLNVVAPATRVAVVSAALSPSGDLLCCGTSDGRAILVEVMPLKLKRVQEVLVCDTFVTGLSFGGTSSSVVIGAADGTLVLWDCKQSKEIWRRRLSSSIRSTSLSSDGQTVAFGSYDGIIGLMEASTGELSKELHVAEKEIDMVSLLPDSQMITYLSKGSLQVIDYDGRPTTQTSTLNLARPWVDSSRKWVVSAGDGSLHVRDILTHKVSHVSHLSISTDEVSHAAAYSPKRQLVTFSMGGQDIMIADLSTEHQLDPSLSFDAKAPAVVFSFSPSNSFLAVGTLDQRVQFLRTDTLAPTAAFDLTDIPTAMKWDPAEQFLAVAVADGSIILLNEHDTAHVNQMEAVGKPIRSIWIDAASHSILFLVEGGLLLQWDYQLGDRPIELHQLDKAIAFEMSTNTSRLFVAYDGGLVRFLKWPHLQPEKISIETGQRVLRLAANNKNDIIAGCGANGCAFIAHLECNFSPTYLHGHDEHVWSIVFSADDKTIATAASDGIRLWDAISGQELARLSRRNTRDVEFSHDQTMLAACNNNGIVSLWKVE